MSCSFACRVLKGFEEKTGIREFLFALPKLEVRTSARYDSSSQLIYHACFHLSLHSRKGL